MKVKFCKNPQLVERFFRQSVFQATHSPEKFQKLGVAGHPILVKWVVEWQKKIK
jgi:hypothetical protein